jgi:cellulose synthase/poly-beta-1,6-N-acetylglucosamine synthase-like glycosyltransferase
MATFISVSLITLACLVAIPITVFFIEVIAAITLSQQDCVGSPNDALRPRVAVLVPAHNESFGLLRTLSDIKEQLHVSDRVLVVADNCTDNTAEVATAAGAEVVVRNDPDRKGKGHALAWGVHQLNIAPPDIVIILDADCRLADSAIDQLIATCARTHRPIQALDLMTAPDESRINSRVAEVAWRVKNWVRPLGLRALGLPCQLMGTGMAFPWNVLRSANLASGLIVEDLKLGLDLALTGNPPMFCPSAKVTSDFPLSMEALQSQRLRWEGGHMGMIAMEAPRLLFAAITRANVGLIALALDVAVPPLSLLGMLVIGISVVSGLLTLFGISYVAISISTTCLLLYLAGVFISWLKFGRDILPPRAILSLVTYVIAKLPLYRRILSGESPSEWIRTDRNKL